MITAESIIQDAMRREGWHEGRAKLIDHPADKGGLTRGGVTAASWGAYLGLGRPAIATELLDMTEAQATVFYTARYLQPFALVPDPRLRALLVDWAFTSWLDDPTKALQTSLERRGLYHGAIDGIFGPRTLAAVQADLERAVTYRDVLHARIVFYRKLAYDADVRVFLKAHPASQLQNFSGWLNRCLEFLP
jgi:lysozyme family protein